MKLRFILIVNLNKMTDEKNQFKNKFGITVQEFSNFILKSKENINVKYINEGKIIIPKMKNPHLLTSWDLWFKKAHCDEMPFIDSYGCYQYLYNNSQNKNEIRPIFVIIPPDSKKSILKELEFIGITESFIFPERTNISKYIKNIFEI